GIELLLRGRRRAVAHALRREDDLLRVGVVVRLDLDVLEGRREEERERAPFARLALDVDLAAEQACDLAADREAEPGAAVAAARRPVCLLERLEDQAQLVVRDADAGVGDRELEHGLRAGEGLAGELPPPGDADPELHIPLLREL